MAVNLTQTGKSFTLSKVMLIKSNSLEHTMEATAIDWNHTTGKLVSGSIDRSVFVWCYDSDSQTYKPEFVNLDEKLSIIDI